MAPTVVKTEGRRAQRSAAPPSPASGLAAPVSPSSPSSGSLAIHSAYRDANKIPFAVDLLEAYVHEAPKEPLDVNPQKDPYIQLYGLSMFVDDYAPQTQAKDEMMSFQEAEALLAKNRKFLQDLLAGDLGTTRQIGETRARSALAVRAWKRRTQFSGRRVLSFSRKFACNTIIVVACSSRFRSDLLLVSQYLCRQLSIFCAVACGI
jgi:hypothetical protein